MVYVESVFLLKDNIDENVKNDYILNFNENEEELKAEFKKNLSLYKIDDVEIYMTFKDRSFGYEIFIISPNYINNATFRGFDGIEIIEEYFEKLLPEGIKKLFLKAYEDYEGEYLFHQHIFEFDKEFDVEKFLETKFCLKSVKWSCYEYEANDKGFKVMDFLEIDNFILQRHVLYEYFSRNYLKYLNDNNILLILKKIDLINKGISLISKHKLFMEDFRSDIIKFIEKNKLFEIHRVLRKRDIYLKIEEDFKNKITNDQQNLNNAVVLFLTILGLIFTGMEIFK